MYRAFLGFSLAPLVPALAVFALNVVRVPPSDAMRGAVAVGLYGYLSALLLGVPAFFIMRKRSGAGLGAYVLAGTLIGLICYAALFVPVAIQNWQAGPEAALLVIRNTAGLAVLAGACGSVAAGVFWAIAARGAA
jgi:hypothetical protein